MGRRLWIKLALSYLAIAVIAVGLAALLFNFALSKQFRGYVEEKKLKLKDEQMVILLSSIYEKDGRWNPQRVRYDEHVDDVWKRDNTPRFRGKHGRGLLGFHTRDGTKFASKE